MAITTRDQLVTASQNAFVAPFAKTSLSNPAPGASSARGCSWQSPGVPAAGAVATFAAPAVLSSATTGAINLPTLTGGTQWYLSGVTVANNAGGAPLTLMDRLSHVTVNAQTGSQAVGLSLPARADAYGAALFVEINTAPNSAFVNVSYTNESGVSGRTATLGMPSFGAVTGLTCGPFTLQAGDFGMRSVESVTQNGAQSGSFMLVLAKQIVSIAHPFYLGEARFGFADMGLPALGADPCLYFLVSSVQSTYTSTAFNGQLTLVAG